MPGTAQTRPLRGTRKDGAPSRSMASRVSTGSNAPERMDDVRAADEDVRDDRAEPGYVEERRGQEPDVRVVDISIAWMQVIAWTCMLRWDSSTPLGRPVVPEVYRISAGDSSPTSGSPIGSRAPRNSS